MTTLRLWDLLDEVEGGGDGGWKELLTGAQSNYRASINLQNNSNPEIDRSRGLVYACTLVIAVKKGSKIALVSADFSFKLVVYWRPILLGFAW